LVNALEFLSKHIKKEAALNNSDFVVCFLEAFHQSFPHMLKEEKSKIERQDTLFGFIRTVQCLLSRGLCFEDHFKQALIVKTFYVLRLTVNSADTVDMGIYSLQILLNAIGLKQSVCYFSKFFSIVTHAYLQYPNRRKIATYTRKIFEFYIKEKK